MKIVETPRQSSVVFLSEADGFEFKGVVVKSFDDFTASFTDEFRDWLFKSQDGACGYCGNYLGPYWSGNPNAHVEHIKPRRLGGIDSPPNLMYACRSCNTSKGNDHYTSLHVKWALKASKIGEVISAKTAERLINMGALKIDLTDSFHFERAGWAHILPLPCPVEHSVLKAEFYPGKTKPKPEIEEA